MAQTMDRPYLISINLENGNVTASDMQLYQADTNIFKVLVELKQDARTIIPNADLADYNVKFTAVKPSREYVEETAVVDGAEDRMVMELPDKFNDQVGTYSFQFTVTKDDEILTTKTGSYKINPTLIASLNSEVVAQPTYEILRNLVDEVKAITGTGDQAQTVLGEYQKKEDQTLTTTAKTIVGAINELKDSGTGLDKDALSTETISTLTTTNKTVVGAINELDGDVGDKASLTTTAKGDLVSAINELDSDVGDKSTLTTTEKTTVVKAINELDSDVGDLTNLTTTEKTDLVGAINEHDEEIGDLSTLTTTAKDSLVEAVNELDSDIGDLTTLTTDEKGDVVGAINELDDDKLDKPDVDPSDGQILSYDAATDKNVWINQHIKVVGDKATTYTLAVTDITSGEKSYIFKDVKIASTDDQGVAHEDTFVNDVVDVVFTGLTTEDRYMTVYGIDGYVYKYKIAQGSSAFTFISAGQSAGVEIVDDLVSDDTDKALSANQGKELKDEIGVEKHYEASTDASALTIVADTATPTATQIRLSDANINGGTFQVGDKVVFVDSTGIHEDIDDLRENVIVRETLTVVSDTVTMTDSDVQNLTISADTIINVPDDINHKRILVNVSCISSPSYEASTQGATDALEVVADTATPNDTQITVSDANQYGGTFTEGDYVLFKDGAVIISFVQGTETIKVKIAASSYNAFTIDLNGTDVIIDKVSTIDATLTEDEINNGILN